MTAGLLVPVSGSASVIDCCGFVHNCPPCYNLRQASAIPDFGSPAVAAFLSFVAALIAVKWRRQALALRLAAVD